MIGLLASLVPILKFMVIPLINGIEPSEKEIKFVFLSGLVLFWCFGLLLLSFDFGDKKRSRFFPTFSALGRWYGAIFIFVWLGILTCLSIIIPVVLIVS
ncbi:hypothetical protein GNT65_14330 [Shewanella sp. JBTF-M18]|uniref:Uncharacterized protein n=1 Tax=Shewanella insulae TaxID=2681496 RepID=A0A6L7HZZ2_9GAMM|nr:hypothetical protein [Shewanella insulae]MXR69836.1 hypothetical protein [Shewanella insulae]